MNLVKDRIYLANLSPTKGVEPGKTRPVVIIQKQETLSSYPMALVAITSKTNTP
jgi:mRNA interferase MazF